MLKNPQNKRHILSPGDLVLVDLRTNHIKIMISEGKNLQEARFDCLGELYPLDAIAGNLLNAVAILMLMADLFGVKITRQPKREPLFDNWLCFQVEPVA